MYDCATALAEGVIISRAANGRKGIAIWGEVNPEYKATLRTYADAGDFVFTEKIDAGTACVVVQYPDYHGNITDLAAVEKEAHAAGALLVVAVSDPSSLALLKPPGEFNADIVVGELQPFGNSMSFGGPGGGFMAIKNEFVKRMPGRLCGMSLDTRGQRAFILTLQAREQHIKREKATSNLCTNQGLNSLVAVIYLSLMGPKGLRQAASLSYKRAHTLQKKLEGLGFKLQNAQPFYNEFAVSSSVGIEKLNKALLEKGMLGGADLGNGKWLLCCTELISEKDIEKFVDTVKTCL
jgi:glycine dehydrogenase subunit 1